jgi:hypothetical protein
MRIRLMILTFFSCLTAAAYSQITSIAQIGVNVVHVPLLVTVTDDDGRLITNLQKKDLRVY